MITSVYFCHIPGGPERDYKLSRAVSQSSGNTGRPQRGPNRQSSLREEAGVLRWTWEMAAAYASETQNEGPWDWSRSNWRMMNQESYSWSLQRVGKCLTLPNWSRKSPLNTQSIQEKLQKVSPSSQAVSRVKSTKDLKNVLQKSQLYLHITCLLTNQSNALQN